MDLWRATAGDPYLMEKNPDEIPMFPRFAERCLAVPSSDFFKGLFRYYDIEYLSRCFHLCALLRSICGNQNPLDSVSEILPSKAAAEHQ
jgi:hypothetical protein